MLSECSEILSLHEVAGKTQVVLIPAVGPAFLVFSSPQLLKVDDVDCQSKTYLLTGITGSLFWPATSPPQQKQTCPATTTISIIILLFSTMDQLIEPRLRAITHRKRSIQACLSCRARKVRCDVSSRGQPCTNCDLDAKNCLLVDRASRMSESPELLSSCSPSADLSHVQRPRSTTQTITAANQ